MGLGAKRVRTVEAMAEIRESVKAGILRKRSPPRLFATPRRIPGAITLEVALPLD